MKTRIKRSKVLAIANALVNKNGWTFSSAQKHAWEVVRAIEAMRKDEIIIRFCKEGQDVPEQRTATLCPIFINYTSTSTQERKENQLQIRFYDTLKNAFRSFNAGRFVSYKEAPLPF